MAGGLPPLRIERVGHLLLFVPFLSSTSQIPPQPLCFDNDLNCPWVTPSCLCAGACPDPVGAANPMFSEPCSLFVASLRSFLHSFPLFSRAWSLFCQNTRGGGSCDLSRHSFTRASFA